MRKKWLHRFWALRPVLIPLINPSAVINNPIGQFFKSGTAHWTATTSTPAPNLWRKKLSYPFDTVIHNNGAMFLLVPKGHRAMDKALACHPGGQGSNPDRFSYPLGFLATCTICLTIHVVTRSSVNTCHSVSILCIENWIPSFKAQLRKWLWFIATAGASKYEIALTDIISSMLFTFLKPAVLIIILGNIKGLKNLPMQGVNFLRQS